MTEITPAPAGRAARLSPYLLGVVVGGAVAVLGAVHEPDYSFGLLGRTYTDATRLKAWIASVVAGLAVVQLVLALWVYGRLPGLGAAPRWARLTHRVEGALLVVLTLPVAVHCLVAYGFQTGSPRVLVHSVAGCAFYGLFAGKVCLVHDRRQPGWALPLVGGLLVVTVGLLWYSAALWVFNDYRVPLLH
jgi:hypothetical protein